MRAALSPTGPPPTIITSATALGGHWLGLDGPGRMVGAATQRTETKSRVQGVGQNDAREKVSIHGKPGR